MKLNDTHQLLDYAKDIDILGGGVHGIKKKADALEVATKEIGLEVNEYKPKYTVISRDKNAGRTYNIKLVWKGRRVKIFGKTLTNKNSIQEKLRAD